MQANFHQNYYCCRSGGWYFNISPCKIKNKMVFQSFSEKARANFDPSLKMLQIHASSKKFGAYWGHCFRQQHLVQPICPLPQSEDILSSYIIILPEAPKSGAPAAAPLPPRQEPDSRTDPPAPLCHSLAVPDLPPGYAGNFRQTFSL